MYFLKNIINSFLILSLVIATKFRPLPILQKVIDYLGANRYFVIYSPIQEPLIECHSYLKQSRKAVHMELADNWLRDYFALAHPSEDDDGLL